MSGVPVARANARNDVDPFFVVDGRERLQRGNRIGLGIDRADLGSSARRIASVQGGNLGLLDAAGIRQHVGTEIDGAARRKNAAGKSVAHEFRQASRCGRYGHGSAAPRRCRPGETERPRSSAPSGSSVPETARSRSGSVRIGFRRDSRSPSRCGPRRKTGSSRSSGCLRKSCETSASACNAWTNKSSSGMALVECGTLCVERIERMPDRTMSWYAVLREQRVGDDGVDRSRTGRGQRPGAGDHGAARGNDIVHDQGGTTGNAGWVLEFDFDGAVAAPGFLRNGHGKARAARRDR